MSARLNPAEDIFDLNKHTIGDVFHSTNDGQTPLAFIKQKSHVRFLEDYLGSRGLGATFAVAERHYIYFKRHSLVRLPYQRTGILG